MLFIDNSIGSYAKARSRRFNHPHTAASWKNPVAHVDEPPHDEEDDSLCDRNADNVCGNMCIGFVWVQKAIDPDVLSIVHEIRKTEVETKSNDAEDPVSKMEAHSSKEELDDQKGSVHSMHANICPGGERRLPGFCVCQDSPVDDSYNKRKRDDRAKQIEVQKL